jgi:hypothetical protein
MKNQINELKKYFLEELAKTNSIEELKELNDSLLGKK